MRQNGIIGTRRTKSKTGVFAAAPLKRGSLRSSKKLKSKRGSIDLEGASLTLFKMSGVKRERDDNGLGGRDEVNTPGEDSMMGLTGARMSTGGEGKRLKFMDYSPSPSPTKTALPAPPASANKKKSYDPKSVVRNRVMARLQAARKEWSETNLADEVSNQPFDTRSGDAAFSQAYSMKQEYNHNFSTDGDDASSTQPQPSFQAARASWSHTNTNGTSGLSTAPELGNSAFSPASFATTAPIHKQEYYQSPPIHNKDVFSLAPTPASDFGDKRLSKTTAHGPYVSPYSFSQAGLVAAASPYQGFERNDSPVPERDNLQARATVTKSSESAAHKSASDAQIKQVDDQWYVQGYFVGTPAAPLTFVKQEFYNETSGEGVFGAPPTVPSSVESPFAIQGESGVFSEAAVAAPAPNRDLEAKVALNTVLAVDSELSAANTTEAALEAAGDTITVHERDYCDCNLCELGRENAKNLPEWNAVSSPSPKQKAPKRYVIFSNARVAEYPMLTIARRIMKRFFSSAI